MKPETESSVSKAKTDRKTTLGTSRDSTPKRKTTKRQAKSKSRQSDVSAHKSTNAVTTAKSFETGKNVSDLEFLDTVKETVYRKLLDNELDLKIDSGFKAIELKNKISETSESERLLLEILSEIRSEELNKSKS